MKLDESELLERATRAYFRSCAQAGGHGQNPANDSGLERHGGKDFIVLRNVRGILSVYQVIGNRIWHVSDEDLPVALGGTRKPIVPKGYRLPDRLYSRKAAAARWKGKSQ